MDFANFLFKYYIYFLTCSVFTVIIYPQEQYHINLHLFNICTSFLRQIGAAIYNIARAWFSHK